MNKKGLVRIGTSNVVVPGNKTTFPPAFQSKSRLHYYSNLFNTVEVNSSFYKTPQQSTYRKWMLDVPDDFQFSIKLSKDITHVKELKGELAGISGFMHAATGLGTKKGCLLIQFPGKITLDHYAKVEEILKEVSFADADNAWRKAVEFRHPGWYTGETFEMLDEYGATMVLHDIPKAKHFEVYKKAAVVYIRFHGPKGDYRDSYAESFLSAKATEIQEWMDEGRDVYVYFNNTIGSAFENAISLREKLHTGSSNPLSQNAE